MSKSKYKEKNQKTKCNCEDPSLIAYDHTWGRPVNTTSFRVWCRNCRLLYGWYTKRDFKEIFDIS